MKRTLPISPVVRPRKLRRFFTLRSARTSPRTGAWKAPVRPRPTAGTRLRPQQAVPVPSARCQHASLPFCFDASAGALLTHQLICSGAEARLTRTDRVPMKAPGTVYYFSGRASEEQPKQITGRTRRPRETADAPVAVLMQGGAALIRRRPAALIRR